MKLLVSQGSLAGQEFTIDRDVTRVGSDPHCEIKLPAEDIPAHAFTLRRRGRKYVVYNRCPYALSLGEKSLAAEQSSDWEPGQLLSLRGLVGFVLEAGAPAPRATVSEAPEIPAAAEEDEWEEEFQDELESRAVEEEAPKKKTNVIEMAVTACLVIGSVMMMLVDPGKGTTKVTRKDLDRTYAELSAQFEQTRGQDPLMSQIEMMLKGAALCLGKGDRKGAEARYVAARNIMLRRLDREGRFPSKLDEKVDEFVRNNLMLLQ